MAGHRCRPPTPYTSQALSNASSAPYRTVIPSENGAKCRISNLRLVFVFLHRGRLLLFALLRAAADDVVDTQQHASALHGSLDSLKLDCSGFPNAECVHVGQVTRVSIDAPG